MKKIIYITSDTWWDTDISILPFLTEVFNIEVFCMSPVDVHERKYPNKYSNGMIIHDYKIGRSNKDIRMAFQSLYYVFKILLSLNKSIVIWTPDNKMSCILLMCFLPVKKTVISLHNYNMHGDVTKWQSNLQKWIIRRFNYFHFHSTSQESLFKIDFPNKKSFSTQMPIKNFGSSKKNKIFDNSKRTFLFFGGIRTYKRLDLFIKASNYFKNDANFIVAGNCPNWEVYKDLIDSDNNIKCDIRFIENEDIANYYSCSDFLVLPYDDSTQSGPLLTAYNYNLPIIASSLPYFKEMIVDKQTGLIFEVGNIESLISAIAYAINMTPEAYSFMKDNMDIQRKLYVKKTNIGEYYQEFINSNMV